MFFNPFAEQILRSQGNNIFVSIIRSRWGGYEVAVGHRQKPLEVECFCDIADVWQFIIDNAC
jgi:hypothetical protein